jgi:diguanylate cyclase (GGDEF)-like protein
MSSDPIPRTEQEQGFWNRREKFPAQVEAAFQREMDRIREQRMRRSGVIAALLYGAFALSDRAMVPDVYRQAWAIRLLLVVPLILLCSLYAYKLRNRVLREVLLAATLVVSGISIPWIAALSSHANAAYYDAGITLIVLFGNIVLNLRFRSAVITSVLMIAGYAFVLNRIGLLPYEVRFSNWLLSFAAVAISLVANFRMDQDQRRAYLARVREQERNAELSHAVELLAKLSSEDALTRIANRREFERRFAIEWGRARRERLPLALIMIDIDRFKNYNDHYGHPAGDDCLQRVAAALQAIPKRPADLVARYGGEEFVVLLPATALEEAAMIAERLRQAVADLQIPHATSRVAPGVTASLGVAAGMPLELHEPAELMEAADAALYRAKENGRNRVETAS